MLVVGFSVSFCKIFLCFVLNVQDILKDYLDKRERGDLLCQKKTYISEFLNRKVSSIVFY